MDPIRCFVVDDELEACLRMQEMIRKFPELDFTGYEVDPESVINSISEKNPDILFLDVEMPGKNGLDLVREIRDSNLKTTVVFVLAFEQYAISAIRVHAFDYLLKPIDITEFKDCIERYKNRRDCYQSFDNTDLTEREKQVARYSAGEDQ